LLICPIPPAAAIAATPSAATATTAMNHSMGECCHASQERRDDVRTGFERGVLSLCDLLLARGVGIEAGWPSRGPGSASQQESNYAASELRSSLGADPDDDHSSFTLHKVLSGSMRCCPLAMARPMSRNCLT
jgi:hypothetical protein